MTCKCKDENGSPSDVCLGICKYMNNNAIIGDQKRDYNQIMIEAIIDRVNKIINYNLNEQRKLSESNELKMYRLGLKEGMEIGFQMGRDS